MTDLCVLSAMFAVCCKPMRHACRLLIPVVALGSGFTSTAMLRWHCVGLSVPQLAYDVCAMAGSTALPLAGDA